MGICNHCSLKRMRENSRKTGYEITLLRDAHWGFGGVNVYAVKKDSGIDIRKLKGGEDGPRSKYRVAWFMSIGKSCEC
jgi:hypothetical protein